MSVNSAVIPTLIYADAPRAIAFLCEAFGFTARLVVPGATEAEVAHAELTLGGGMVMAGSATARARELYAMADTSATGGLATGGVYVVVPDPDAHHATAVAAGAEVVEPPRDNEYGGRGYAARDCEGRVWSFGSYDPWAGA